MSNEEIDPVCKMKVTDQRYKWEIDGQEYFFCSEYCLEKFKKDPKKYLLKGSSEKLTSHLLKAIYQVLTFLL